MVLVASRLPTRSDVGRGTVLLTGLARAAVALATATIGVAVVGALAVRPIADDFVINSKVEQLHGPLPAFGSWMTTWTGYYSGYGLLTALAGLTRAVGVERFTYAIASVAFLAVLDASVRACVGASKRLGVTDWGWPHAIILTAGLLGSFVGPLKDSLHTNLYEAIYWASSWVSHLLPVVACPLLIIAVVRIRNRSVQLSIAFLGGVFIAGFGLAETVVVTATVCAFAWVTYRMRGRDALSKHRPTLTAAGLGLVAGTLLVALLPGTLARAHYLESSGVGLSAHRGLANLSRATVHIALSDAKAIVLSPAPILGLLIGLALCLVLVSWLAVAFGDLSSSQASWHLLPLATVVYVACLITGYALGTHNDVKYLPVGVGVCLVAALAWTTMQTTVVAEAAIDRARVFDDNVRAAHVAAEHSPPRSTIWYSMSIGNMTDATASGENAWAGTAVAEWLGIPPDDLVFVPVSLPKARFF
jgi:hypothetical protein